MSFRPAIEICNSVPRSLLAFAKRKAIDSKLLDFELLSHETFIKRSDNHEYELVEKIDEITQEDILNPDMFIMQKYRIEIKALKPSKNTIQLSLGANKLKTKASLTIKKGSGFSKELHTVDSLKKEIYKRKLRAGIFIEVFEDNLEKKLQKLLESVTFDKPTEKDITFSVAQALTPIAPIDTKLEKIYMLRKSDNFITGILKGDLIAKFTLEKEGLSGRAYNGKFIPSREPRVIDAEPTVDETISTKKNDEGISYYAATNGYVLYQNNNLTISKDLKLEGASFKKSATINAKDADNDISVHIGHNKSHTEDAIGSGVNIEVKELNVDGSVASNVNITTDHLNIDAQTHKNSKMQVTDTARIKLHRGDLTTREAHIDILESGKITASESAHMRQTLGGIIIAPIVKIDEMISNTTVIASERIEIKTISGENNKLIIDPDAIATYHEEIISVKEKIEVLQKDLEEKKTLLTQKIKEHASQIDRIKAFQKRVLKATKEGKKPMKQDIIRVKQYKKDSQKLQIQKEEIDNNTMIQALQEQLDKLCNKDLHAIIESSASYDGHTKVTFINPDTKEEVSFLPEGKTPVISLTLNSENKRIITTQES